VVKSPGEMTCYPDRSTGVYFWLNVSAVSLKLGMLITYGEDFVQTDERLV